MREKGGKENLYFLLVWPGLTQPFTAHCLVSAAQHSQGGASICLVPGNNFKAHFSLGHPESGPRTKEEKKKKQKKRQGPTKGLWRTEKPVSQISIWPQRRIPSICGAEARAPALGGGGEGAAGETDMPGVATFPLQGHRQQDPHPSLIHPMGWGSDPCVSTGCCLALHQLPPLATPCTCCVPAHGLVSAHWESAPARRCPSASKA